MNSKIKILMSVLLLFAFLSPIYATEEQTPIETEGAMPIIEIITNDSDSELSTPPESHVPPVDANLSPFEDAVTPPPKLIVNTDPIFTKEETIRIKGTTERMAHLRFFLRDKDEYKPLTFKCKEDDTAADISSLVYDFSCDVSILKLEEGHYEIRIIAVKLESDENAIDIKLIKDITPPVVIIDSISTTARAPVLHGTIKDNLTEITTFTLKINGKVYPQSDINIDENGNWSVQLETLPIGTHNVNIYAKDKAGNETPANEMVSNAITIRRSSSGGTRIVTERPAAETEVVNPAPAPETPATSPVVTQPTVVNTPTTPTTGGGTPTETLEETSPLTGNVPVANPTESSGSTGFLGLSNGASISIALIIGALLVVGALGYFLFFSKK